MAHDEDPAHVLAAGATSLILRVIVVILHFVTRTLQKAVIGIDDWLTLPALVCVSRVLIHSLSYSVNLLSLRSSW